MPESTKANYIPMEGLSILGNQRYRLKLDEKQTSNMIKFAVTLPKDRWAAVQHGLRMLDWENDPVLRAYDMQIATSHDTANAGLWTGKRPSLSSIWYADRDKPDHH